MLKRRRRKTGLVVPEQKNHGTIRLFAVYDCAIAYVVCLDSSIKHDIEVMVTPTLCEPKEENNYDTSLYKTPKHPHVLYPLHTLKSEHQSEGGHVFLTASSQNTFSQDITTPIPVPRRSMPASFTPPIDVAQLKIGSEPRLTGTSQVDTSKPRFETPRIDTLHKDTLCEYSTTDVKLNSDDKVMFSDEDSSVSEVEPSNKKVKLSSIHKETKLLKPRRKKFKQSRLKPHESHALKLVIQPKLSDDLNKPQKVNNSDEEEEEEIVSSEETTQIRNHFLSSKTTNTVLCR